MEINKIKTGGNLKEIQNKYPLIKILLDQFQNFFLDPEKTVNLFIKVLDAFVTNIGFENYALALQKPLYDFNQLLVFLFNFIRQKYISAFLEIINLVPYLSPYLGILDSVTMQNLNDIEFNNDLNDQLMVISDILKNIKVILSIIQNKLKIQKNLPFILSCPIINDNLKQLFNLNLHTPDNQKSKYIIKYDYKYKSIQFTLEYFNYNNDKEIHDNFNSFIDSNMISISNQEDFNLIIDDQTENYPKIVDYIKEKWKEIKTEIRSEFIKIINQQHKDVDNQINSETKIFISGNGLNGCLAILTSIDTDIQQIFCEIGISKPKFFIITLGCPNFVDKNFQKLFLKRKNIIFYHFIYPFDFFSYLKFNYQNSNSYTVPLGFPTILCSPNLVLNFYNEYYLKVVFNNNNLNELYNDCFRKANSPKFRNIIGEVKIETNSTDITYINLINFNQKIEYSKLINFFRDKYFSRGISEDNNKYLNNVFYNTNVHQ